jgi:integrase
VPLQTIALDAIERQPSSRESALVFPALRSGYLDLHNFRNREWKPAQVAAGIKPLRRIYDLRHTFATFRSVPASLPSTSPATWARA